MLTLIDSKQRFSLVAQPSAVRDACAPRRPNPTAVVLGFASPTVLFGLESVIAAAPGAWLEASAQTLEAFVSACARVAVGVALIDPALGQRSMPDLLDACIRAAPRVRPILLMDEHQPHVVREALRHGACGLVDKSASPEAIRAAIATVAAGQRYIAASLLTDLADSVTLQDLTKREMDVLRLLAQGRCNKAIARELEIALGTVKTHVRGIMSKLTSGSRTEAVLNAYRLGLVGLPR
jgi:DNA-binding NarL/FixJ family response regulator